MSRGERLWKIKDIFTGKEDRNKTCFIILLLDRWNDYEFFIKEIIFSKICRWIFVVIEIHNLTTFNLRCCSFHKINFENSVDLLFWNIIFQDKENVPLKYYYAMYVVYISNYYYFYVTIYVTVTCIDSTTIILILGDWIILYSHAWFALE